MMKAALCDNLENLMKVHGGLSVSDLARKTSLPQPTLHHILVGTTKNPRRKALAALADFFSVSIAELLGDAPLATKIPEMLKTTLNISTIPVIAWKDIPHDGKIITKSETIKEVILDKQISEGSFALILQDNKMEPIFPPNAILIFDPSKKPKDRDFALTYLARSNTILFNRFFVENNVSYIKQDQEDGNVHLNKLHPNDKIIATLTEVRLQF